MKQCLVRSCEMLRSFVHELALGSQKVLFVRATFLFCPPLLESMGALVDLVSQLGPTVASLFRGAFLADRKFGL